MMNIQQQPIQVNDVNTIPESALMARIRPLMDEIDISTDCEPRMIGAINSVAASGGEPSEEAIKLLILKDRGEINMDEYKTLVLEFADARS